jgi:hypothetical protein
MLKDTLNERKRANYERLIGIRKEIGKIEGEELSQIRGDIQGSKNRLDNLLDRYRKKLDNL